MSVYDLVRGLGFRDYATRFVRFIRGLWGERVDRAENFSEKFKKYTKVRILVTVLSRWVVKMTGMKNEARLNHEDRFWAISRSLFAECEAARGDRRRGLKLNAEISPEELEAVAGLLADPSGNAGTLNKQLRALEAKIAKAQGAWVLGGWVWPWNRRALGFRASC